MATKLNPYINFKKNANQAIDFYQSVFGGKVAKTAFKDGGMEYNPADADKIMHAQLDTDNGMTLMVSDAPASMQDGPTVSNISISLSGDDEVELHGYFDKLSGGGSVTMPLSKAPWGDSFGMCTDKYGVGWMVNIVGGDSKPA